MKVTDPKPLTPSEQEYIREHSATMPVRDIASHLKRGRSRIADFIDDNGLERMQAPKTPKERCKVPAGCFDVNAVRGEVSWIM